MVAVETVLKGANQVMRIPLVRDAASRHGLRLLDGVVSRGLGARKADFKATAVAGDRD